MALAAAGWTVHPGVPQVSARPLSTLLRLEPGPGSSARGACPWSLGVLDPAASDDVHTAARLIADTAMSYRCGPASALDLWRARAQGGPALTSKERQVVDAFIEDGFGLPGKPMPPVHLQGAVAEWLWYCLTLESAPAERKLVHLQGPSYSVTEPGGDGLAVWEITDGTLVFRLWEIKQHDTAAHLSRTVARACDQLSTSAMRYLAKFTSIGSTLYQGPLGELYAALPDLWADGDPRAGAGVALATSASRAPRRRCFGTLTTKLPALAAGGRLEGLVVAVAQFPAFAELVQGCIWSGR
jgi:hypothetical protein